MKENVRQFLIDALGDMQFDVSGVTGETSLGPMGLDLESLTLIELGLQLEDAFGVKFDEDDNERISMMTIDEFADEVVARVALVDAGKAPA